MKTRLLMAATLALLGVSVAQAQDSGLENRMRQQLQSTTQQLRELQDSQSTLQAQKAAAEQERDALKAKVHGGGSSGASKAAARRDARTIADLRKQLADAQAANGELSARAGQAEAELAKTKDLYVQAAESGRQLGADRDRTRTTLGVCVAKNDQLYKTGREILDAYARVGFGEVMARKEPLIGIERVKLENLAQDHRDRLEDGRVDPKLAVQATQPQAGGGQ